MSDMKPERVAELRAQAVGIKRDWVTMIMKRRDVIALLDAYDRAAVLAEQNARMRAAVKVLFDWYNHDGSVGGASVAFDDAEKMMG